MRRLRFGLQIGLAAFAVTACTTRETARTAAGRDTVVVYAAASLAAPLRALADSYAVRTGTVSQIEIGGSLEHARKLTELHRIPDVLVLADYEVLASLMPRYLHWYLSSPTTGWSSRTPPSRTARAGSTVPIGAACSPNPGCASAGPTRPPRRPATGRCIMLQLAERDFGEPGLAARVLANAPSRFIRPNASELAALLDAGEVDYILDYESVARAHHFRFVTLPASIDLSDPDSDGHVRAGRRCASAGPPATR